MIEHKGVTKRVQVYKEGKRAQTRTYTIATCPLCGSEFEALLDNVKRGITKTCGCNKTKNTELVRTRTHKSWQGMKERCTNKHLACYKSYGARGITYDPKWEYFDAFLADMGLCPEGASIDRIDNNGNYTKENCRWATATQQANNRRSNLFVEHRGERMTLADWSRLHKKNYKSVWFWYRDCGLSLDEILQK